MGNGGEKVSWKNYAHFSRSRDRFYDRLRICNRAGDYSVLHCIWSTESSRNPCICGCISVL